MFLLRYAFLIEENSFGYLTRSLPHIWWDKHKWKSKAIAVVFKFEFLRAMNLEVSLRPLGEITY
jgi:hypothetical protein